MNDDHLTALYKEALGLLLQTREALESDIELNGSSPRDLDGLSISEETELATSLLADCIAWLIYVRALGGRETHHMPVKQLRRDLTLAGGGRASSVGTHAIGRLLDDARSLHLRLQDIEDGLMADGRIPVSAQSPRKPGSFPAGD